MNLLNPRGAFLLLLLVATSAALPAQVTNVRIPDSNPAGGVTSNVIPFGSAFGAPIGAWSHLTIVPASMLLAQGAHAGDRLIDIQFAPCGTGTVHMPQVQVVVGHLVSPLPTFSLASGFSDQVPVYDSTVSGQLDYSCTANTWSSLGIGGGNLAWNGMSDVGIYTTHSGLTISSTTGWQGSFWRGSALMRHYANAYQAPSALTSALNGLKIGLTFANPSQMPAMLASYGQGTPGSYGVPLVDAQEFPYFGNQAFGFGVVQALPGTTAVLLVSSQQADVQIGAYTDVHLLVDLSPAAASFMLFMPVSGSGTAFFGAPLPNYVPELAGATVYCQWAIVGDPNGLTTVYGAPLALTDGLRLTLGI